MRLGEVLKNIRTKRGFYQRELAEIINVEPQCISNYERENRDVSIGMLKLLTKALSFTLIIKKGNIEIKEEFDMTNFKINLLTNYENFKVEIKEDTVLLTNKENKIEEMDFDSMFTKYNRCATNPLLKIQPENKDFSIILKKEKGNSNLYKENCCIYSVSLEEHILFIHDYSDCNPSIKNSYSIGHSKEEVLIDEEEWNSEKFEQCNTNYKEIFERNNGKNYPHQFEYTSIDGEEIDVKDVNDTYYTSIHDVVCAACEILVLYKENI